MKFVIFHGAYGSPDGNWFPQLQENLEGLSQKVTTPLFPTPKNQSLQSWLSVFEEVKKDFKEGEPLCFIGHSLGPLFILHVVEKYNLQLDSAIFVSPFLTKLFNRKYDSINKTFYKEDFDFDNLKKRIPLSYTLYSDNDPYVSSKYSIEFAKKLESSLIEVRGGKHLNSEGGFTSFPLIFQLCKTRMGYLQG